MYDEVHTNTKLPLVSVFTDRDSGPEMRHVGSLRTGDVYTAVVGLVRDAKLPDGARAVAVVTAAATGSVSVFAYTVRHVVELGY